MQVGRRRRSTLVEHLLEEVLVLGVAHVAVDSCEQIARARAGKPQALELGFLVRHLDCLLREPIDQQRVFGDSLKH